ncbi:GMC family oxidoreductase [Actinocorallia sp. A-T 12471]|uniref:GMC family oxidoreductase n=1 Tax=Actinocorallia sp. A-T 12471 TaxID=3089813 RepID=UPI0029CCFF22|nr:GMC family oxidoreductase [Actinocorallia sp. A-T 12471]MDX6739787.1 GMC family oxidoreductase [Actinocorallia sp. A-T 12471]
MAQDRVETVDAVVVGSGFGGSVAALRLAEAGLSTVLLERGRSYAPGQFPRTPTDLGRAFWDPAERLYGMFDVWRFKGFDSVVSSGLGGGSLIYANVLLRKDERWFVHEQGLPGGGYEHWPVTRKDLDPFYDEVEAMIGVTPYPVEHPPYAETPKTHAMQDAAAELGLDWFRPPLAVSFGTHTGAVPEPGKPLAEAAYGNLHGVPRTTCRLCGECDIGCNDGAKNSLDHTYLSAAARLGADLRPLHEVEGIRTREGGGYLVDYVRHDPATGGRVRATLGCARLVLAAGTFGTTRLLLRSKLPGISSALGTRLCGNGDLLTFLTGVKGSDRTTPLDVARGPVITSAVRLPDQLDGFGTGRGAYIEEGGYPGFVDFMAAGLDVQGQITRAVKLLWERFTDFLTGDGDTNMSAEVSQLLSGRSLSAHALPLLGMGRDVPDGVLSLDREGRLKADWSVETSREYFDRLRATMRRIGDVLGADYADNPLWLRKRVVSVHPLGGAPIGRHPREGVCDPFGEVFGLPGLYVADGAALPGPVGANPSLTIAALAERMCRQMLHGDLATGAAGGAASGGNTHTGARPKGSTSLSFTEEMKGTYVAGATEPHGGGTGEKLAFRLTITAADVDRFLREPDHLARAEGWVDAAAFGGRRRVEQGSFNLFVTPGDQTDRREMRYLLHFTDVHGAPRTLAGWKDIQVGPPTHIWPDTTTLYYRVMSGHVPADSTAPVLGAGTLHIRLADFLEQLTTFRTDGPDDLKSLTRFGHFFLGELWDVYGPPDPTP